MCLIRKDNSNPRLSTKLLASKLQKTTGIEVHPKTVRQCLGKWVFIAEFQGKSAIVSAINYTLRLYFAKI